MALLEQRTDLSEFLGPFSKPIQNIEELVRQHPDDAALHCILGATLLYTKRSRTIEECEIAIQLYPTLANSYFYLGEVYRIRGETSMGNERRERLLDKAKGYYKQALAVEPCFIAANSELGVIHFNRGEFDEAIQGLEIITSQIEKPDATTQKYWDEVLRARGIDINKMPEYSDAFAPLVKVNGFICQPVYYLLALSYGHKGMKEERNKAAEKWIGESCDEGIRQFWMGYVSYESGDHKDAIEKWSKISRKKKEIDIGIRICGVNEEWILDEDIGLGGTNPYCIVDLKKAIRDIKRKRFRSFFKGEGFHIWKENVPQNIQ